jgi:hypothetical protein
VSAKAVPLFTLSLSHLNRKKKNPPFHPPIWFLCPEASLTMSHFPFALFTNQSRYPATSPTIQKLVPLFTVETSLTIQKPDYLPVPLSRNQSHYSETSPTIQKPVPLFKNQSHYSETNPPVQKLVPLFRNQANYSEASPAIQNPSSRSQLNQSRYNQKLGCFSHSPSPFFPVVSPSIQKLFSFFPVPFSPILSTNILYVEDGEDLGLVSP